VATIKKRIVGIMRIRRMSVGSYFLNADPQNH